MPSLLDLSAELKLTVVEQLELEEQLESEKNLEREEEDEEGEEEEKAKSVRDWPIMSLSSTCKVFRTLCAPFVFKSLVLVNNEKNGASIQSIADSANADFVRNFRFTSRFKSLLAPDGVEAPSDKDFPASTQKVLENLKAFPKLERLAIKLPGDRDYFEMYPDDQIEEWEEVVDAEERQAWRALTKNVYAAIAQNHDHESLKHLELVEVVGKDVSSWHDESFRKFLGNLDSLKISLMGGENGAGWCMNTNGWYGAFVENMSEFFFKHLTNVTQLSLCASTDGPIGLEGTRHAPVLFPALSMPKLRSLHLKHNFISSQLIEFINGHADVLERVHLDECYSALHCYLAENAIPWSNFFSRIVDAEPSALLSFEVTPVHATIDGREYGDMTDEVFARMEKELAANPERHLFAYSHLDGKYGMLFEDYEGRVEAFDAGVDQAAFDRLMAVVVRNIKRNEKN
ncbi:hypothetical protein BDV96DRAFT_576667 [Lophiotrema nucula]|uniref:F-box domain-containing protein n=1 Tax=Lophiotrema nucula TaxID=690887 RepID=A0A6A5Z4F1_9PLEO|nr:hypothetical protein BDV96DRAFT_576667 [Lophiotrema nucula]